MLFRCHIVLAFLSFSSIAPSALSAQSAQSDFLPLSIGNQWVYKYSSLDYNISLNEITSENGLCTSTVIGRAVTQDSVTWTIAESHVVTRSVSNYLPGRDTSYSTTDSTTFQLIESLDGNHVVYRDGTIASYWKSAFSFSTADDTSRVHRYCPASVDDTLLLSFQKPPAPAAEYVLHLSMVRGQGIIGNSCQSGSELEIIGFQRASSHVLQSYLLMSVGTGTRLPLPKEFALRQNFPNPFNPATTIQFSVPTKCRVKLAIFNLLGQRVAELVNEEMNSGSYERTWNANVASGMYFYRLEAVSASDPGIRYVEVKKMVLLR